MGSFISRQPNGLLCRFSSVVDTVTHHNMTDAEYIEMCADRGRKEAIEVINEYLRPFDEVKDSFVPNNMTEKEFKELINEMSNQVNTQTK